MSVTNGYDIEDCFFVVYSSLQRQDLIKHNWCLEKKGGGP